MTNSIIENAKKRLDAIENPNRTKINTKIWRPTFRSSDTGNSISFNIRFIPTPDNDPLKNLFFHYFDSKNTPPVLCPKKNYGEDCPICGFATNLWRTQNDLKQKFAKQLFAKERFYAPVIVREDEEYINDEGDKVHHTARWFGFSSKNYQKLLRMTLNQTIGNIYDPNNGFDFQLVYTKASSGGFPNTDLERLERCPISKDEKYKAFILNSIPKISEVFEQMTTNEVQLILDKYLQEDEEKEDISKYGSSLPNVNSLDSVLSELNKGNDDDIPF